MLGFDMDYTLVTYDTDAFEGLVHSLSSARLVEHFGYPPEVADLPFERDRAIVGLVVDKRNGNLLKLNRFDKVKIAYHGLEAIDFREHESLYRERAIDLRDPDFSSLDTAFAISQGVLYGQLVQMKKERTNIPDFRRLDSDVMSAIDSLHKDGTLKNILKNSFDKYVVLNPKTSEMLETLKNFGKKLVVITNSDYEYTRALLDYSLNPYWRKHKSWRDVFDLVITLADKPKFFAARNRFLKIDPESAAMTNHEGPVSTGIWQGGWFGDVQEGMGVAGNEILYLGDHIYGDVVSIKKLCDWRTGLVLGGLAQEIQTNHSVRKLQAEIDALMERKTRLELESNRKGKQQREVRGRENLDEQEKLNTHISNLLDRLKSHYNPWWGEMLRAGIEESRYAGQVENYACIYMTHVSELGEYSPRTYFRPRRRLLAHELE